MMLLVIASSFVASFLLGAALNWISLAPWRRSVGAHWTERARRLFPARKAAALNLWFIAINAAMVWQILRGYSIPMLISSGAAAWAGVALSGYLMDRQIWPGLSFKRWFGQFVLYAMFLQVGILLMIIGIVLMPARIDWQTWVIAGVILAILLAMVFGFAMVLLRAMRLIHPAPARVDEIARREAERAGAKLNLTLVSEGPAAHAFAMLPMNHMLFSDSLLRLLSEEELASICAHEASHLAESKWIFAARVLGALMLFPMIFIRPAMEYFGLTGLMMLLAITFVMLIFYRRLGRRMEMQADANAAEKSGDPAIYARAMEKLYEINQMPAVMPKRSGLIHPDLYDRMLAVGVTPAYERPQPPGRAGWPPLLLYGLFVFQVIIATSRSAGDKPDWEKGISGGEEKIHLNVESLRNNSETNALER